MILGFGVVLIGVIGVVGASVAVPPAVIVGGVMKLRRGRGLAAGLLAWVLLTIAAIVGMFLGLSGNAGHGMYVYGASFEDVTAVVPWAWLAAAVAWLGFFIAARRQAGAE
jgi:Zn-dependent protease